MKLLLDQGLPRSTAILLLGVLVISFLQASTLTYRDLGQQIINTNHAQLPDVGITYLFISNHIKQLGTTKLLSEIASRSILLFLIQCIPVLFYEYFKSIKSKRIVVLVIWLVLAIIGFPILKNIAVYLFSPLFSIGFFADLMSDSNAMEDFAEGFFPIAAIGWFNLFWLGVTIKAWFFPKQST
jgi:hypothetical protein